MHRLICRALEEYEKERLARLVDDRYEKVVLPLFEEAHGHAKGNVFTPVVEAIQQAVVKAFFNKRADELRNDKMYKLAESHDTTQGLVRHLINLSAFTVSVARVVIQQAEKPSVVKQS